MSKQSRTISKLKFARHHHESRERRELSSKKERLRKDRGTLIPGARETDPVRPLLRNASEPLTFLCVPVIPWAPLRIALLFIADR